MDTYTLIPNGTEVTFLQGPDPVIVNAYLIQHDQTGYTMKWRGAYVGHYPSLNWERFGPLLSKGSRAVKEWKEKELRRIKQEKMIDLTNIGHSIIWDTIKFDDCKPATSCAPKKAAAKSYQTTVIKENTMHYASAPISADQAQRDYLLGRLSEIRRSKEKEFASHFKLDPVKSPCSMNELIQKIKDEDFTLRKDVTMDTKFFDLSDLSYSIRWTKEKADRDGFDKAVAELKKAEQAVKDQIVILDPKDGLKVLNDFQSKTFH